MWPYTSERTVVGRTRSAGAAEAFCEAYGACVLCDQTSNYWGAHRVNASLLFSQGKYTSPVEEVDLVIHVGNISGGASPRRMKAAWRVNPDGEVRDTFGCLQKVFAMSELAFFRAYAAKAAGRVGGSYGGRCAVEAEAILEKVPELPFSNAWVAQQTLPRLPEGAMLHMGIYNSLRVWSIFEGDRILGYSNTGGFGIDGGLSSLIGASLVSDGPCFGVFGDLAFFYDMNALGNRHVGNNLRIILVNNGCGTEFKNHINRAYPLGEEADPFVSARGHFGMQSRDLVRHYAEDLGFEYHAATTKGEYLEALERYVSPDSLGRSVLVEVFVSSDDETESLRRLYEIESTAVGNAKAALKSALGEKGIRVLKGFMK